MYPEHFSKSRKAKESSLAHSILVWGVGDFYFIVSVIVAILFGMLSPDIQKQLHLDGAQLGILGSVFFLCYGFAQLFGGHLIDSWGPRITLTVSALIVSCGLFISSLGTSFNQLLIGQALSGLGLSTSYIGAIFLASTWFKQERFALVSGISQTSANLMAVIAIIVIVFSGGLFLGFQFIMRCLAILAFFNAVLLFIFVRKAPGTPQDTLNEKNTLWSDIKVLVSIPQFWFSTLYFSASFGVLMAFSNLWHIPDQLNYGNSLQTASMMNAMCPLGGAFGAIAAGWLADFTKRTARVALFYIAGMLIVSVILIYSPPLSTITVFILIGILGFFFGGAVLGFPLVSSHIPALLKGTGFGLMATVAYILSAFLQYLIGLLLNESASITGSTIHAFKIALSPLVITLAIGFIGSIWLRDH